MLILFGFVLLLIPGVSLGLVTETLDDETHDESTPLQFPAYTYAQEFVFPSVPPEVAGDDDISWTEVLHDTQDGFYRSPGWGTTTGSNKSGAVPVGTNVVLRLRTKADDVVSAKMRYWDGAGSIEGYVTMAITSSVDGYDYWEGTFISPSYPSDYYYRFILTDGSDTDYYQDDYPYGGPGQVVNDVTDGNLDFGLIFYDPAFTTPEWHKNAIGYQIFTDSFFNGDVANDAIGDGSSNGDIIWFEWDSNGDNTFTSADSQRQYALDNPWGSTPVAGHGYYGGDLAGVAQKADYLASLGVKLIWFCPISQSPDNHGYAVDNYNSVDPYYGKIASRENGEVINNQTGSMEVFDDMIATLDDVGIRAIYDAVLNHASAQSKYFQRFEFASGFDVPNPYETEVLGAYQTQLSPYYDWFKFNNYNDDYDAWWGFLNIPTLMYSQAGGAIEDELISGDDSLFAFWNEHNISGFRLDVPNMYQDGDGSRYINKLIRDQVKTNDPSDILIGEIWGRANAWLTGTMQDGVQNMPFGDATISWLKGGSDALYVDHLLFPQENYPPEAFYSLWTILGNHDTARVLTRLDDDKDAVLLAATLQFTYPGVPMVYYGDEAGLAGASDPNNRGAYPWGSEDISMQEYYQKLGEIRNTYPVLRTGSFELIPDAAEGILIYGRELPEEQYPESVVLVNRLFDAVQIVVNISTLSGLNSSDVLSDVLGSNQNYTISDSHTITVVMQPQSALILMYEDPDWGATATEPTDTGSKIVGYSWGLMLLGIISITSIIGHTVHKNRRVMK